MGISLFQPPVKSKPLKILEVIFDMHNYTQIFILIGSAGASAQIGEM